MDWINIPKENDSLMEPLWCILDCDLCFFYTCSEYVKPPKGGGGGGGTRRL